MQQDVNYVNIRALNCCLFKMFSHKMTAEYELLLLHKSVKQKHADNLKLPMTQRTSVQTTLKLKHGFLIVALLTSTASPCCRWNSVMWSQQKWKNINPIQIVLEYLGVHLLQAHCVIWECKPIVFATYCCQPRFLAFITIKTENL